MARKEYGMYREREIERGEVSLHCMSSKIIVMQLLITCCSLDTLLCCLLRSRVCSLVMPHPYQSPSSSNR
eukprot:scaffold3072_cov94-Alexandrium_tamarense.AAC.1